MLTDSWICRFLTLLSCVCGRSVSRGFSMSCVWPGSGPAGRLQASLRSGPVYRTGHAQWSSNTSTHRRSRRYWLRRENKRHNIDKNSRICCFSIHQWAVVLLFKAPWQLLICDKWSALHYMRSFDTVWLFLCSEWDYSFLQSLSYII